MARNHVENDHRYETKDTPAELNFDEDRALPPNTGYGRRGSVEHDHASISDEGGLSGTVDNTASADELAPETMLDESGGDVPLVFADAADTDLSVVNANEIGGGEGLDEAELAVAEGGGPTGDDDEIPGDEGDEDTDDDDADTTR